MKLRWPVIGLATAVVLGSGTAYAVTGKGSTTSYRTAVATISDVEQTLSTTGLVDAARRADLSFGTDGTVATMLVAVGDTVKTGQVIGKLGTTDLDAALTQAKADYARAVAQLASDRETQASAVGNVSTPTTPSAPSTPSGSSSSSAATAKLLQALKKAQDQVILAQSQASQALAAAKQALAAQQAACSTPTATPSASATPTDVTGSAGTGSDSGTCSSALVTVQQAQDLVSGAQDGLAKALDALGRLLSQALGQAVGQTRARTTTADATTSNQPSSSQSSSSGGQTVTAAQLASDQARIEEAAASVVGARQDLAAATVRSTRSGTVVALDATVGDRVTAGSTVVTVVGGSAVTVTGTVTESQVNGVKVGQTARVSVPGVAKKTTGTVTAIGLVADSSTGTTSYPVTVTVEDPTISLPTGSRAMLQIVLATAKRVVTVPISAVTRSGSGAAATVSTWNGSTLSRATVQLGAIGAREVAISSGLSAGSRVVLADIGSPIKGAATSVNDRGGFQLPGGGNFRPPAGAVTFSKAG